MKERTMAKGESKREMAARLAKLEEAQKAAEAAKMEKLTAENDALRDYTEDLEDRLSALEANTNGATRQLTPQAPNPRQRQIAGYATQRAAGPDCPPIVVVVEVNMSTVLEQLFQTFNVRPATQQTTGETTGQQSQQPRQRADQRPATTSDRTQTDTPQLADNTGQGDTMTGERTRFRQPETVPAT
jgi:hypothetical protein